MKNTLSYLKDARGVSIAKAMECLSRNDFTGKAVWEKRRSVIDKYILEFEQSSSPLFPKSVFFSYSVGTGRSYYEYLKERLILEKFEILDGFQKVENTEGNVLKKVITNLKRSSIYIGILTQDIKVLTGKSNKNIMWSPSVWVMEEKGMALALNKPFMLIIDKDIHPDFWQKTAANKDHCFFKDTHDFYAQIDNFVDKIKSLYTDASNRFLQQGDYFDKM